MRVLLLVSAAFILSPILYSHLIEAEIYGDFWPNGAKRTVRATRRNLDGDILNHGKFQQFYQNGQIEVDGQYEDGEREGEWIWFFEDGTLKARCSYSDNVGTFTSFYPNGNKLRQGRMEDLTREGVWVEWFESGNKRMEGQFVGGEQHGLWRYWADDGRPEAQMTALWEHGERVQ